MLVGNWDRLPLLPIILFSLCAFGEDTHVSIEPRQTKLATRQLSAPNLKVNTSLVRIPLSVTDLLNHPVRGLTKDSFRVFDGNTEQEVLHLAFEDAPLAIGLVFDTSGSMGRKMTKSRAAVAEFLRAANPEDEFFLVEFDDSVKLTQARTSEAGDILAELNRVSPRGRTALLDAIALGLEELRKSDKPRKALVILSDGGDNRSRYSEKAIRGMVQESDARIYAIGIFESSGAHLSAEEIAGPGLLNEISESSGGRMYTVRNINDLPSIASRIGVELHNQYVLAYSPTNLQNDGKHHRVRVKVTPPAGLAAVRADWRAGYRAPAN